MTPYDRVKTAAYPVTSRAGRALRAIDDGIRQVFIWLGAGQGA